MDSPLVSIIILNYKRRAALKLALDSALGQEYPKREIIVVDNHSEDNTAAVVRATHPDITVIELPENLGAAGGRNAGIRAARGDIIITLDNDVLFLSPQELTKVVAAFAQHPNIHLLAFQVCDHETGAPRLREWCHPRSWKDFAQSEFETHFFVEGACAYRREVFAAAGLYYEPLFIYTEGLDLALRFLDHGFRILYCPRIKVGHLMSPETRVPDRLYYLFTRNYIWIAYKDYRIRDAIPFLMFKLTMMAYFTVRSGRWAAALRGLWHGVRGLPRIHRDRTPVSRATVRYMAELDRWRPSLLERAARHRAQPQL